jgi:hypothetical protein
MGELFSVTLSYFFITVYGTASNVVDLYSVSTGAFSTARLSVARCNHAAVSVGSMALFAGGYGYNLSTYTGAFIK